MPPAKPAKPRKRQRKRKRRAASSSSSSSESSSPSSSPSSDESAAPRAPVKVPQPTKSDSESEDSSSSGSEAEPQVLKSAKEQPGRTASSRQPGRSPSASPPPAPIPPFRQEPALKERFRQFWMASIADGFKDDLDVLRKEPNMSSSRLGLLVESLAAGADVFGAAPDGDGISEMEVVLDQPTRS